MSELQKMTGGKRTSSNNVIDNDKEDPLVDHESEVMRNIMKLFDEIRENLKKVQENNAILDRMTETVSQVVTKESETAVNAAIKKIVNNNIEFFKKNKHLLDVVKTISKSGQSSIVVHNKEIIVQNFEGLAKANKETMNLTLSKEKSCEQNMKERIKRQLKAVDTSLNDDELREAVEDPDRVNQILQKNMLGPAHLQVQNYVKDIKEKYDNIKILEQVSSLERYNDKRIDQANRRSCKRPGGNRDRYRGNWQKGYRSRRGWKGKFSAGCSLLK